MGFITDESLQAYRAQTFRLHPECRLNSVDEAINFVNQRGFVFFWPIKDVILPSLWSAVAGNRPVADEHDDPGHVTWGWKDSLLGQRRWYYARVLRRRNTIISLNAAPLFYALTENYGSPEEDYLIQYQEGRLTLEGKLIYEALLNEGALDTISLRKASRLSNPQSVGRFNKALDDLMVDFKILPIGISEAGAWHYAFIYDIAARHMPEIQEKARFIQENKARQTLVTLYFASVGAARLADVTRLFNWKPDIAAPVLERLVKQGEIINELVGPDGKSNWFSIPRLIS